MVYRISPPPTIAQSIADAAVPALEDAILSGEGSRVIRALESTFAVTVTIRRIEEEVRTYTPPGSLIRSKPKHLILGQTIKIPAWLAVFTPVVGAFPLG